MQTELISKITNEKKDKALVNIKTTRTIAQTFVAFSEKLNFSYLIATVQSTIIFVDHFDFLPNKYDLSKNSWPHCTLAKAPPSSLLNCVCAFSSSSPAIIVQSGPVKNPLTSAGHHQMWKLKKKMKCRIYTANIYRDLQGLCGEIGVRGFQIYGECMYTRNPCNFEISTLWFQSENCRDFDFTGILWGYPTLNVGKSCKKKFLWIFL